MNDNNKILQGHSDPEKGAYLGAIASIATADRQASEEEMEYVAQLCEAADLSPDQKESVMRAATELSSDELTRCLDILKKSDLRFSLVTDLMAFAKSDENYNEAEQENRGYYTGVFGYFDGKTLDSGVMIRFIERNGEKYFYRSGGGITTQSLLESEYQEAIDKVYVPVD